MRKKWRKADAWRGAHIACVRSIEAGSLLAEKGATRGALLRLDYRARPRRRPLWLPLGQTRSCLPTLVTDALHTWCPIRLCLPCRRRTCGLRMLARVRVCVRVVFWRDSGVVPPAPPHAASIALLCGRYHDDPPSSSPNSPQPTDWANLWNLSRISPRGDRTALCHARSLCSSHINWWRGMAGRANSPILLLWCTRA